MKTTIILISVLCLNVLIKQEVKQEPLSKVANVVAPKKAIKLQKDQSVKVIKSDFKFDNITPQNLQNVYQEDGIFITFGDYYLNENVTLAQMKAREIELINQIGGEEVAEGLEESKIIKIRGKEFYILKRHFRGEYFYRFSSERKNFKGITGTVQFKLADKEKATKIFEDLLNSIKLK